MNCTNRKIGSLLERYLLGRLDVRETENFEDHLFECRACRVNLQEEEMLRSLTRQANIREARRPLADSIWRKLRDGLQAVIDDLADVEMPVVIRGSAATANLESLAFYPLNLSDCPAPTSDLLPARLYGNDLTVHGFHDDLEGHELYLLVCARSDLSVEPPDDPKRIRDRIRQIEDTLMTRDDLDESIMRLISRCFVARGILARNTAGNVPFDVAAHVTIQPIGLAYLLDPDYLPVIVLR